MKTRGLRNNNPLNIRRSPSQWLGKVPYNQSTDCDFEQFTDMAYGYRAACRLIANYTKRPDCTTVQQIISRWAPMADGNNVKAYVSAVVRRTGLSASTPIRSTDDIIRLVCGMAFVESALVIKPNELRALFASRSIVL